MNCTILSSIEFNKNLSKTHIECFDKYILDFVNNFFDYMNHIDCHNFLLNTHDISNNCELNIIEKFIYDVSKQNIYQYNKKNNTNFSIDDFYIEFWSYSKNRNMLHYDFDEKRILYENKIYPVVFTSMTYLSESNTNPFILFDNNINIPFYDKKNNEYLQSTTTSLNELIKLNENINDTFIKFYFPKKYENILFIGSNNYHGTLNFENNIINRPIIGSTFYFKKQMRPLYVPYFSHYSYLNWYYKKHNSSKIEILNLNKILNHYNQVVNLINTTENEKKIYVCIKNDINIFNEWFYNIIANINCNDFNYSNFDFLKTILYEELKKNNHNRLFKMIFKKGICN